mgnify:CR=1 FL=1
MQRLTMASPLIVGLLFVLGMAGVAVLLISTDRTKTEVRDLQPTPQFSRSPSEDRPPTDIVGPGTTATEQCFAGIMQLRSPFKAPYFYGKNEPELGDIWWAGWVDICIDGTVRFGDSYGSTEDYGGDPRGDDIPNAGTSKPAKP